MMALRCLHPPSGAVALTAVLGGPAVHDLGYGFLLWPVAGNSLILLALALLYNNMTGRPIRTRSSPQLPATAPAISVRSRRSVLPPAIWTRF